MSRRGGIARSRRPFNRPLAAPNTLRRSGLMLRRSRSGTLALLVLLSTVVPRSSMAQQRPSEVARALFDAVERKDWTTAAGLTDPGGLTSIREEYLGIFLGTTQEEGGRVAKMSGGGVMSL